MVVPFFGEASCGSGSSGEELLQRNDRRQINRAHSLLTRIEL